MKKEKMIDDGIFEAVVLGAAGVALFFAFIMGAIVGGLWAIFIAFLVESYSGTGERKEKITYIMYFAFSFLLVNSLFFEASIDLLTSIAKTYAISFLTGYRIVILSLVNFFISLALGLAGAFYLLFVKETSGSEAYLSTFSKKYFLGNKGLIALVLLTFFSLAGLIYFDFVNELPRMVYSRFNSDFFHRDLEKLVDTTPFTKFSNWVYAACFSTFVFLTGVVPLLLSAIFQRLSIFSRCTSETEGISFNSFKKTIETEIEIQIGHIKRKKKSLAWRDINHHIQVLGPTGSGKSVLLRNIYGHLIAKDRGLLLIDLKGDLEVKADVAQFTRLRNRSNSVGFLDLNSPRESIKYNPLLRGGANELKDKFMLAFDWSEQFYKKKAESFMIKIFSAVEVIRDKRGELLTLKDILHCMEKPVNLLHLMEKVPFSYGEIRADLENMFIEFSKDKRAMSDLTGLKTNFEVLVKSNIGEVLCSHESIDLLDVIENNQVILASLDGQRFGETSAQIGRLLVADMRACSGQIASNIHKNNRPEFTLMIDEFADIVNTKELGVMFANLLNRSRSSGIGCIIAHQSFGDFDDERVKRQILDNTETLFCFVQKDDESAEKISRMIGTERAFKSTQRVKKEMLIQRNTGDMSVRETEEFLIHPNKIKNLDIGKCIYFAKKPTRFGELDVRYLRESEATFNPKDVGSFQVKTVFSPYSKVELTDETLQKHFKKEEKNERKKTKTIGIVGGANEENMET